MDSHTLLVNKLLSLLFRRFNAKWPTTLLKLGYKVHGIEHSMHVKGGNVSPDIILTSTVGRHALVIECKSGANVDKGQGSRYGQVTANVLHSVGVPTTVRSHAPIYAINEEHVDRIRGHTDHALLVFGSRRIYGIGDFGDGDLYAVLRNGVPLEKGSSPNTDVYPFSVRDAPGHIDEHVSRAVRRHLLDHPGMAGRPLDTRAAASAILREAHPPHRHFSGPHRRELRRAVARSIARQEGQGGGGSGLRRGAPCGHRRAAIGARAA